MTTAPDNLTITAVIPAYNVAPYIARALDSVFAQTRPPDEIIVIDDGSTDDTLTALEPYRDRINLIAQANAGASVARNTGINAASSDWIAFLDGDDEWLPHHLASQADLLSRHPDLAWSTANYLRCLCRENLRRPDQPPAQLHRLLHQHPFFDDYFHAYRHGATGNTDTMIIRTDVLHQAGLFQPHRPRYNDMDLWFRVALHHPRIGYLPEPAAVYHLDPSHISRTHPPVTMYRDLIRRHLDLTTQHHRLTAFRPLASHLLRRWLRSMLFYAPPKDIRLLLREFDDLFTPGYKSLMHLLTTFPRLTRFACHTASRLSHLFRLRSRLQRKSG